MKKKIIALLLATVIVVGAALGGTLAYLTDGQGSVNVATVGNVKIEQFEMQRAGDKLVEFKQGQPLYPAYYQGEAPVVKNGYWTGIEGAIDKIVYVENTGRSDAYIRTWIALECPGEMKLGTDILVNKNDDENNGIKWTELAEKVKIDGQMYAIICATYTEALAPGEVSAKSLLQVAMAKTVDDEAYGGEKNKTYEILAFTQAVQTKNMPNYAEALKEAFGDDHPWTKVADGEISNKIPDYVTNVRDLKAALENGGKVYVGGTLNAGATQDVPNWTNAPAEFIFDATTLDALTGGEYVLEQGSRYGIVSLISAGESLTLSDMKITANSQWPVYLSNYGGTLILKNIDVTATQGAGIYPYGTNGTTTIKNATVNQKALSDEFAANTPWAGTAIATSNGHTLIIDDGTYVGSKWGVYVYNSGANVTINGGTFKAPTVIQADGVWSGTNKSVVTVNGGNFDGALYLDWGTNVPEIYINGGNFTNFSATVCGQAKLVITGGTFDADPSAYVDTEKAYVENADGKWEVLPLYSYETVNGLTIRTNEVTGEKTLSKVSADFVGETLVVPDGINALGSKLLDGNTTIKEVVIPAGVTNFGGTPNATGTGASGGFFYKSAVEKIILPEGLTEIPVAAFNQAANLKEVNIPSTVETIGINAFAGTGLTELTIPATVESIGYGAFRDMVNLKTVTIKGDSVYIPDYTFRACANLTTIYMYVNALTLDSGNMAFTNTSSNNENPNNITIYVANDSVYNTLESNKEVKCKIVKATVISTAEQLVALGGTNIEGTLLLANDIDMSGKSMKSMVVASGKSVTFIGTGSTISNLTLTTAGAYGMTGADNEVASLFDMSENSGCSLTVNDLTLENVNVSCDGYAAAIVGYANNSKDVITLNNVDVNGAIITSDSVAAFVGYTTGTVTLNDCEVSNLTLTGETGRPEKVGAYVGTANTASCAVTVTNCKNNTNYNDAGRVINGARWNGNLIVSAATQEELSTALNTGDVKVQLPAGEYTMPSSGTNGEVIISGTKDTVIDVTNGAYLDSADGVTIEGVTIKTGTGKVNGNGSDYAALYAKDVTYINCTFVGPMRVGRDGAKFINCTFTDLGNDYVWTYGNDVTFEGCTFKTAGKAILIYSDGGNEVSKVTVKNCTFEATAGAKASAISNQNCAAIEIHNYGNGVDLVTAGNTYDSNFSGEWRIKTYENGKPAIFVNGTEYNTIAIDGKTMTIDADKNVTVNN